MRSGLLSGIRVLDATHVLSGPACTMLLADAGAEVIKVERPGGDPTRHMGPFAVAPDGSRSGGYFIRVNRGKQSVCLNLKHPGGQAVFKRLAAVSDVVIENFAPGTMAGFGLDYQAIKAVKPNIIYVSISGFGNADAYPGPYDNRLALNEVAQAMGGIMDLTGRTGGPPIDVGAPLGDIFPGVMAAFGITSALLHRNATGEGKRLDISMYDCMVFLNERSLLQYSLAGIVPTRGAAGTTSFGAVLRAKDGYIAVRIMGQGMWRGFCDAIGQPDLFTHPLFLTDMDRLKHSDALREIAESWLSTRDKFAAAMILGDAGVAAGAIQNAKEVFENPITRGRGMLTEVEDPKTGVYSTASSPLKVAGAPQPAAPIRLPLLGEHTESVLSELLQMTSADIQALREEGAIV